MLPVQARLRSLANPERAKISAGFFKTGLGQYGEGDVFLGITVPDTRKVVREFLNDADLSAVDELLKSEFHEERLAGVILLVEFAKKKKFPIPELAEFYLSRREYVNNWDLVDVSSGHIVGPYLFEYLPEAEREALVSELVASPHLWTNRIVVIATFFEIMKGNSEPIVTLAPKFFSHRHDLMHKAVGWMLRETGKRASEAELRKFLDAHSKAMPRTMLRYAIERLDAESRKKYMAK